MEEVGSDDVNLRYEHIGSLGSGGMAIVYKALDRKLNRIVAIKRLSTEDFSQESVIRFEREAKACATLQHPNIVQVYDFGLDEKNRPFLVMDFLDGQTLEELIAEKKIGNLNQILEIFIQLLDGLSHAHSKGIVHRDLKPSNVMILGKELDRPQVKLMDFGIAKIRHDDSQENPWYTKAGQVVGSPLYMSPEQTMGSDVDARSDIYAVGCMLFEVLTGTAPFKSSSWMETMTMHRTTAIPRIRSFVDSIHVGDNQIPTTEIEAVVKRATEKNPDSRYQTAADLKQALQEIQEKSQIPAPSVDPDQSRNPLARLLSLRRVVVVTSIAVGFVIAVSAGLWSIFDDPARQKVDESNNPKTLKVVKLSDSNKPSTAMLGFSFSDYWQDSHEKYELPPDLTFSALPIKTVRGVSVGHMSDTSYIHEHKMKERNLRGIGSLVNLDKLHIRNIEVTEDALKEISTLKYLNDLLIGDTAMPPDAVKYLKRLHKLQRLSLESCSLRKRDIEELSGLESVSRLDLSGNDLSDPEVLRPLANLPSLTTLCVAQTGITDRGVKEIARLSNLKCLEIGSTFLSSDGYKTIGTMNNLISLTINMSSIQDSDVKSLLALKHLEYLDLERCIKITDACVPTLSQFNELKELNISATKVTDDGVQYMAKHSRTLKKFKHSGVEDVLDYALR